MRLTYWYSQCPDDSDVYSIREKTKREALAQIAIRGDTDWPKPVKVSLQYIDSFDLLEACSNEGHHFWEA